MKTVNERLKVRGDLFKQLPIKDWEKLILFEKFIKNYLKIKNLLNNGKDRI